MPENIQIEQRAGWVGPASTSAGDECAQSRADAGAGRALRILDNNPEIGPS